MQLGGLAHHVDHGQRVDALEQVLAGVLAERIVGRREVEHVVDDLEAHAEVTTEARERVEGRVTDARHHAADATRRREQRGGLAFDGRRVVLFGAVDVEEVLQLEHLTATQLADGRREQRRHVGTERRGQRRCTSEQEVACEDGDDVAPARVHAGHAAARLGFVDHVVVVERSEVHQLARHRAGEGVVGRRARRRRRPRAGRVRRDQREGGAQPLAAGADEVGGDLGEERIGRLDRFPQRSVDADEVVRERRQVDGQFLGSGRP